MKRILLIFSIVFLVFASEKTSDSARPLVLSLSGGGARGLTHIGVLKYFEEVGIVPDTIVGTSMGAIVGALYACGYSADEIYEILKPLSRGNFLYGSSNSRSLRNKRKTSVLTLRFDNDFNVIFPKGIVAPQALDGIFASKIVPAQISSDGDFDKLPIPLRIFTTNLSKGNSQIHKSGDILQIIKASSAAPGLLPPVKIGNDWHIDGGLRANIPLLDSIKREDYFVFAVDVTSEKGDINGFASIIDVITLAVTMGMEEAEIRNAELADVVVSPLEDDIKNTDFYLFDELVQAGYVAAKIAVESSAELQSFKNRRTPPSAPPSEFFVNAVEIQGIQKTRERYLRRILNLNFEKPITEKKIEDITKVALASDNFETFHFSGRLDTLTAVVTEKEKRRIDLGIRIDNHNLAEVLAAPRYSNIFGYGISAGANFQIGFLRKKMVGEIVWNIPIKQNFNYFLDFNVYMSSQRLVSRQIDTLHTGQNLPPREIINYSESDITKNGINVLHGFEFANSVAVFSGFRNEKYKSRQSQDGGNVAFDFADGNNRIRMLIAGMEADFRDDTYFPTSGNRVRFWLSGASDELGSKDRFLTVNGSTSFVIPINHSHTLIPLIYGTWADRELPSAMTYYIGGGRYEEFTSASNILYTIPFAGVENRGLFADNFFMFELCWRYQLAPKYPLYFSFYVNSGNIWNYHKDTAFRNIAEKYFTNIPVGLETELAYRTIVGPVRFSWSQIIFGEFYENFDIKHKSIFRFSAGFDF